MEAAEHREGVGLPAHAVIGGHQLGAERLSQRVLPAQRLEGREDLRGMAARELGFDEELLGRQPELCQPLRLGVGPGLVRELGVRVTAPERQCGAQSLDGADRVLSMERSAGSLDAGLEVDDVEGESGRVELVPR